MSSYHDRHVRRPRVPSLNQMDPTELAAFAVSRVPRSPVIPGLVINHHISGRILAESPPDLIDHLTEGLGHDVHDDFLRLSLDAHATVKHDLRRLRPLTEIVAQINTTPLPPSGVSGPVRSPPAASMDDSFAWDFGEESDSDSGCVSSPRSDSITFEQDTAGDSWDHEDTDAGVTHEGFSSFSFESPGTQSDTPASVHSGDDTTDGTDEDSIITERNAALGEVLLALTDPGLLAVSSAVQRHTAGLNATIVGGPSASTDVVQRPSEANTLPTSLSTYFAISVNTSLAHNTHISSHIHVGTSFATPTLVGRRPARHEASGTDAAAVFRDGRAFESGPGISMDLSVSFTC